MHNAGNFEGRRPKTLRHDGPHRLRIASGTGDVVPTAADSSRWLINGLPTLIRVWTPSEWEGLDVRPAYSQVMASGLRIAVEME